MQENVLAVDLNACARQVLQARGPGADQKGPNQWRDSRLIMLPPCSCDVVHRHAPRLWQQREWQHGDARHPQKFPCTGGRRVRTSGRHKTKGAAHTHSAQCAHKVVHKVVQRGPREQAQGKPWSSNRQRCIVHLCGNSHCRTSSTSHAGCPLVPRVRVLTAKDECASAEVWMIAKMCQQSVDDCIQVWMIAFVIIHTWNSLMCG
jgi:hypothetical protein